MEKKAVMISPEFKLLGPAQIHRALGEWSGMQLFPRAGIFRGLVWLYWCCSLGGQEVGTGTRRVRMFQAHSRSATY